MAHVLLALGEGHPRVLIRRHLVEAGATICEARDAAHAIRIARQEILDSALIDVGLGATTLRTLTGSLSKNGIGTVALAIAGDSRGAWQPSADELEALVTLLLQGRAPRARQLTAGDVVLDRSSREVSRNGRVVALTPRMYALLELFMENQGAVLSADRLLATVWGRAAGDNILHVYIGYLRARLEAAGEPRLIHTMRGAGYVLSVPTSPAQVA